MKNPWIIVFVILFNLLLSSCSSDKDQERIDNRAEQIAADQVIHYYFPNFEDHNVDQQKLMMAWRDEFVQSLNAIAVDPPHIRDGDLLEWWQGDFYRWWSSYAPSEAITHGNISEARSQLPPEIEAIVTNAEIPVVYRIDPEAALALLKRIRESSVE